ncbi:choice-of-anchor D domain-containing protein [bacterium]|nr:choice-of-anchor D domain-containing protein [bacterium]
MKSIRKVALTLGLLTAMVSIGFAADVSGGGAALQTAINAASVGDTLTVIDGGTYSTISVDKNLTIESDPIGAIISGGVDGVSVVAGCTSMTLRGFTVSGNSDNGVNVNTPADVFIESCALDGNGDGGNDSGLQLFGVGTYTVSVSDSSLNGNTRRAITVDTVGVEATINVTNCELNSNTEVGVFFGAPGTPFDPKLNISNSSISGNGGTGLFYFDGTVTATDTDIQNNSGDGVIIIGEQFTMTGGTISGNTGVGLKPDGTDLSTLNIDGVTITGQPNDSGVGLFSPVNATFQNCTISSNSNKGIHRIFNYTADSVINVENCDILSNGTEGIWIEHDGGTAFGFSTTLNVSDTLFYDNAPGGDSQLRATGLDPALITVDRSYFDYGSSAVGLVVVAGNGAGSGDFTNTIFRGGSGGLGVILAENGSFSFEHCTFAADDGSSAAAVFSGGGTDSTFFIRNCIFDGMVDTLVNNRATNSWDVDYSLFNSTTSDIGGSETGAVGGIGSNSVSATNPNFYADPTGLGTGDFHLNVGSAALNAGVDLGVADDYEGSARPNPTGSTPDMGALEMSEPDIDAISPLVFGQVVTGTSSTLTLQVDNVGTETLTISGATISGADQAVYSVDSSGLPVAVPAGGNTSLDVTFEPSAAQVYNAAQLDITSDDPDESSFPVSLQGEGVAPPPDQDINLTESLLDYGTITAGATSDLTFNIDNVGGQDLEVTSISITGTDAGVYSLVSPPGTPFTLAPADPAVTITVRFAPTGGATASYNDANVEVSSDDPDEGTVSVDLDGSGQDFSAVDDWRILNLE